MFFTFAFLKNFLLHAVSQIVAYVCQAIEGGKSADVLDCYTDVENSYPCIARTQLQRHKHASLLANVTLTGNQVGLLIFFLKDGFYYFL